MKSKLLLFVAFLVSSFSIGQCDYTLEITDNFGNEWDSGANLTANAGVDVTINGTTTTYLIENPSTTPNTPVVENYTITLNDGDAIDIDYRATAFPGDGQFRLLDSEDIEVYASPLNQASMMDIFVGTATCPSCFAVTMLTTNAITATTADIGWTATGTETAWEVEYGPVGFIPGAGTTVNATSNPWTINGLMSETSYDVYVRADCGMGDISSNQGPISFTTIESCPSPSNFTAITQTANEIQFTWDANGNTSTNYEVNYGVTPFNQGDAGGQTVPGFFGNFAQIQGLISNTEYSFYVRYDCGMGDFSGWAGPYTATTTQSCPNISGVTTSNVLQTSLDLAWTAGGTETEWEVEYTEAPFTPGTGTVVTATTNPFTLTGLTSGTSYEVCVTAVCAPTDRSTPVCIQVTTECDSFSAPYTQDFEVGFTPTTSGFPGPTEALDSDGCFTTVNSGYFWVVAPGTLTASGSTGPAPSVTTGNYLYAEGSNGALGDIADLVSPLFDTSGLTVPSLAFDYHMAGNAIGSLEVLVRAGGTDTSIITINGAQQANDTDPYLNTNIALNAFAGQTFQIVFRATRGSAFQSDIAIDNVIIDEAPSCPRPLDFSFDGSTDTTVDLSWTTGGAETEWNIEYGAPGFTPGTGTVVNAMTNPFSVTGLTQNTDYEFYISAFCGAGDESLQVGPIAGTTQCDAVTTPYLEDFENGFTALTTNFPNAGNAFERENCYSAINSGYFWAVASGAFTGTGSTGPDPSVTTGNYFYAEGNGNTGDVAELSSPLFDSTGLTVPSVSFDYHMAGANIGSLDIIARAGGVETIVGTLTGAQQAAVTDPFLNINIPLAAYAGQTFQIIFRATRGNGTSSDIAIDNVVIDEAPSCAAPRSLTATTITDVSAVLGWTNGDLETVWDIEIVTAGTAATGVPTDAGVTVNPYNPTTLMSGTTYEFYVRAVCSIGDESLWSGPLTFTTLPSCGDTIYDTGGANGQYADNESYTITYLPSNPGEVVTLNFLSVDVEGCCDTIQLFDGLDVTATAFTTDLETPGLFRATNPDGAITLSFSSDGSVTRDGWVAQYTCAPPPTCLEVTGLDAANFTTSTADLSWVTGGSGETEWDIEIVLAGATPTGTPTVTAMSNPYTITTLASGTTFDYYVRANCGGGSTSLYAGPFTFTTIPACGDTVYDTGGANAPYSNNESYTITYLPENPGDIVTLDFILVDLESCCDELDVFDGLDVNATPFALDLETPALFRATNPDGAITIRFDSDFSVTAAGWEARYSCAPVPTCFEPTALFASNFTIDGATLSWTENNTPASTEWVVEYAEVGVITAPGTGQGSVIDPATNSQDVTGLMADTLYEFYVRSTCGAGDQSVYSGPFSFRTRCNAIAAPYQEGFNTGSTTENCWTVLDANGDGIAWNLDYTFNPFEGDQSANINTDFNGGADDDYLISPPITLTGNQQMRYQYRVQSSFEPNNMEVLLSTTGAGAADFTVTLVPATLYSNTTYMEAIVDLSAYTGTINVAFRIPPSTTDGWRMYIDDVNFEDRPSCPMPDMLVVDTITPTGANFSWNETGAATVWQVEVQPTGVAQGTAGAVFENLTASNPQTFSGLSSETTYDVYVRSDCGMGDFSAWAGPITFSTPCDVFTLPYGNATAPGNNFATFPGNCWTEGNDTDITTGPNGLDGAWGTDDFANDTASPNGQAARINLYDFAGVDNDWLISPSFDLTNPGHSFSATFDVALTEFAGPGASNFGSDDEIQLLITDDNGATWNNLLTWNAASAVSNTGQLETVSLAAYSGVVQLAFWSSRGTVADTADIDFYIDNFTIDGTAGNGAFAKAEFVLYPNPVSSTLFVNTEVSIDQLKVYNLMGQLVKQNVVTDSTQIDVQNLPSGVYLLQVKAGANKRTLRFIKE